MTEHYFKHPRVNLHYYKYGSGAKRMLCFHGFGMHGKQFMILEEALGSRYTFYGFDLFFHKETILSDQSLEHVKKGISKAELAGLVEDFCTHEDIGRFSVIGYSMGTVYATAITEELADRIDEYIVAAPAALNPGRMIRYFSTSKTGNKLLEKLLFSRRMLEELLKLCRKTGVLDKSSYEIMRKELATPELRFNFYATLTYLRHLDTDMLRLKQALQRQHMKSIFVFGAFDKMYPSRIGNKIIPEISQARTIIFENSHEMINHNFVYSIENLL